MRYASIRTMSLTTAFDLQIAGMTAAELCINSKYNTVPYDGSQPCLTPE